MEISRERLRAIAAQHQQARVWDRIMDEQQNSRLIWINDRTANETLTHMYGLKALCEYVRKNFPDAPNILSVGESTGIGIRGLREKMFAESIVFFATSLRRAQEVINNIGLDYLFFTSVEQMKGVRQGSMAAVISCYGIAYSVDPELAIKGVDYALRNGGVFKATFTNDKRLGSNGSSKFVDELRKKGNYGIFVQKDGDAEVITAIKNGSDLEAAELEGLESEYNFTHSAYN